MSSASSIDSAHSPHFSTSSPLEQIIQQKLEAVGVCLEKYKDIPGKIVEAEKARHIQTNSQPIHLLHGAEYLKIAHLEAGEAQKEIIAEVKNIQLAIHMYFVTPSDDKERYFRATLEKQEGDLTVLFKQIQKAIENHPIIDSSASLLDRTKRYLSSKLALTHTDEDEKREAEREADLQAQMKRLNSEESTEQAGDVVVGDKEEEADQ